jgi:hypothetical protein
MRYICREHPRTQVITVGLHSALKGFRCCGPMGHVHQFGQELKKKVAAHQVESIVDRHSHSFYADVEATRRQEAVTRAVAEPNMGTLPF